MCPSNLNLWMFKECSQKNGKENARNKTARPKDKRMDQTKDKSDERRRTGGKAKIEMGWPFDKGR